MFVLAAQYSANGDTMPDTPVKFPHTYAVRLSEAQIRGLERLAARDDRPVSYFIRAAIDERLAREAKQSGEAS
ncbi:MAG: ribbon-helix-helix protein, CopG family [Armatimonadia bacterium]|nr:ribbon-helix-helix protein, CopG family [Armatimonadia bacterium]